MSISLNHANEHALSINIWPSWRSQDSHNSQGKIKQDVSRESYKGSFRNSENEEQVLVRVKKVNQSWAIHICE